MVDVSPIGLCVLSQCGVFEDFFFFRGGGGGEECKLQCLFCLSLLSVMVHVHEFHPKHVEDQTFLLAKGRDQDVKETRDPLSFCPLTPVVALLQALLAGGGWTCS